LATSRAIAANGEVIEDSEVLVTYDGSAIAAAGPAPYAMLPDVVTGAAGDAVDFLSMIEFRCTGARGLWLHEYNTGRRVAFVEPYSSLILRSYDVGGDTSRVEWKVSDTRKEIVADANQTHVADLAVTDGTTTASTMSTAMSGTWAAATANSEWDTEVDAVAADYETNTDASFAEVETTVNAILALLAGGLVHETS
jgi:hypothetical protein